MIPGTKGVPLSRKATKCPPLGEGDFVQSPFSCSQLVILLSKSARICIRHCLLMPETTPNTSVDPHSTSSHRCSHSNITHFTPSGDRLRAVTFCSHLFVRLSCSHAACTDLPWSLSSPQHMPPHLPQPPLEAHCLGSCTAHAHRRAPHSAPHLPCPWRMGWPTVAAMYRYFTIKIQDPCRLQTQSPQRT